MKRKILLFTVCLALLLFILLLGTLFYTGVLWFNMPSRQEYPVWGVDVSNWQGEIDWPVLAAEGMDFAFLKATEGKGFTDARFAENWQGAHEAGLLVGAYHFLTSSSTGAQQADHFIATVPRQAGMLPPVIDIEVGISLPGINDILDEMIALLEAHYGVPPILYVTHDTYDAFVVGRYGQCPVWIRDVMKTPALSDGRTWLLWQYSNRGRLGGYEGEETYIDLNVFAGSREGLEKLWIITEPEEKAAIRLAADSIIASLALNWAEMEYCEYSDGADYTGYAYRFPSDNDPLNHMRLALWGEDGEAYVFRLYEVIYHDGIFSHEATSSFYLVDKATLTVTPEPKIDETPDLSLPSYTPAIRSARVEAGQASLNEVVVDDAFDNWYSADESDCFVLELTCEEPLTDLLIIDLMADYEDRTPLSYEEWLNAHRIWGIRHYLPSFLPGQAIRLNDAWAVELDLPFVSTIRITYTNSTGQPEAAMVFWDVEEEAFICQPVAPLEAQESLLAENGPRYEVYPEVVNVAHNEDFAAYIPHGFQLHYATCGDINGDGLEDALLILAAAGYENLWDDGAQQPLFILLGQPEGGYEVVQKLSTVTYMAARHHTTAVAGDGYIDIVHEGSGGAAYSYIEVARFAYDSDADDWLMGGYSWRHIYDYERAPGLELVAPLPVMAGMSLSDYQGNNRPAIPDMGSFSKVADLSVVWNQSMDGEKWWRNYVIGVCSSADDQHYEGYIFAVYDESDYITSELKATFRGELPAAGLSLKVDAESFNFTIGDDVWQYNEDIYEFLLGGECSWFDD